MEKIKKKKKILLDLLILRKVDEEHAVKLVLS